MSTSTGILVKEHEHGIQPINAPHPEVGMAQIVFGHHADDIGTNCDTSTVHRRAELGDVVICSRGDVRDFDEPPAISWPIRPKTMNSVCD